MSRIYFSDFNVTKREILFSITILCFMIVIGVVISNTISTKLAEEKLDIFSSVKIDGDENKFDYIKRTDAGCFLANGELKAIKPVSLKELGGHYMEIRKVREVYRMHTQTYTTSDGKGNTSVHVRCYWSWDYAGDEVFTSEEVTFLGKKFKTNSITFNRNLEYKKTIVGGVNERFVYYTYPLSKTGIMSGKTNNKNFTDLEFIPDTNIDSYLDKAETIIKIKISVFWVVWFLITGLLIFLFYYAENKWLED